MYASAGMAPETVTTLPEVEQLAVGTATVETSTDMQLTEEVMVYSEGKVTVIVEPAGTYV